jgi:hypothetical protein
MPCKLDFKFKPWGCLKRKVFISHSTCLSFPPGSADGVRRTKTGCIATETCPILKSEIGLSIYSMTMALAAGIRSAISSPGIMFLVDDYCVHCMGPGRLKSRLPGYSFSMFPFSDFISFVFSYFRDLVPPRLHSRVMHRMTEMEFYFYFFNTSLRSYISLFLISC